MSQVDALLSSDPLPPSPNRRSWARRVVTALIVLALLVGGFLAYRFVTGFVAQSDFEGAGTGSVEITVARGDTLSEIARTLRDAGVVRTADAFLNAAETDPRAASIGPGRYLMRLQMSGTQALALMLDPDSRETSRLVLPEGLRLQQTVDAAAQASGLPKRQFEAALEEPATLGLPPWSKDRPEGFLFPATYDLVGDETADALLRAFVRRFGQASADLNLEARAAKTGFSPYEVLIIASLIQAEGVPNDFAKVSRVIYNRLEEDMPLQLDSTVAYALGIVDIQLNEDQLQTQSPYNTYENRGLPPTPINSPGEAAIEAALSPAKGRWLYFVTVNPDTKETKFTRNYDTFLKWKKEFQAYLEANPAAR